MLPSACETPPPESRALARLRAGRDRASKADESVVQAITAGQEHGAALAHDLRPRGLSLRPHSFSLGTRPVLGVQHGGGGAWRPERRQGTVGKEVR